MRRRARRLRSPRRCRARARSLRGNHAAATTGPRTSGKSADQLPRRRTARVVRADPATQCDLHAEQDQAGDHRRRRSVVRFAPARIGRCRSRATPSTSAARTWSGHPSGAPSPRSVSAARSPSTCPSMAWKMITARVSAAARARSMLDQRKRGEQQHGFAEYRPAPTRRHGAPRMYSGIAAATSAAASSTCAMPRRRLRAASTRQQQHQHAQRWRRDGGATVRARPCCGFERTDRGGDVVADFVRGLRPRGATVAGRPVGAAQARIATGARRHRTRSRTRPARPPARRCGGNGAYSAGGVSMAIR